jgi:ATP-binding cassette, subfamily B, bacterial
LPPQYDEFNEDEYQAKLNNKTFLRILGLAKSHWRWLISFIIAIAIVSSLDSYFTFLSKQIIDSGILAGNKQALVRIVVTYGSLILIQAVGVFSFIYLVSILGERIRYDLRQKMFNHLQDLSLSYYSRTPVGWIMARVSSDSDRVADLMTWGLLDSTWASINIVSSAYFMIFIDFRLALIVLATLPLLIFIAVKFRKKILVEYRNVRKNNSRITGAYNENITGVRVVKALTRENQNLTEFSQITDAMYRSSYRAAWLSALFLPTVQIISAIALGFVVWIGGGQVHLGGITIGGIQAFITYITFIMWPIQDLARIYADLQHAVASAERIFTLVDTVPDVVNYQDAAETSSIKGEICFDHVNFYYDDNKPILSDLTLKIKEGETIALVGPTGGGKTTIVNLLCRFYEPKQGKILIGGTDYTRFSLQSIQSRIGIVLQTPHLFSGTVRDNILYGRLNATSEEVEAAARIAGAHDFIKTLDKGYSQEVGEGGNQLSVGQKQLISLARAFLANPEIFIMDEATSSVDTLTESLIQRGMEALMKGRTSVIIAHRLSTIRRANKILVIDNGQVTEEGTHAELVSKRGHYYRLYTQQFRKERETEYEPSALQLTNSEPASLD